jgi:hypothetical protein
VAAFQARNFQVSGFYPLVFDNRLWHFGNCCPEMATGGVFSLNTEDCYVRTPSASDGKNDEGKS